jgi:hypothetical protein
MDAGTSSETDSSGKAVGAGVAADACVGAAVTTGTFFTKVKAFDVATRSTQLSNMWQNPLSEMTKAKQPSCASHEVRHSTSEWPPPPRENFGARLAMTVLSHRSPIFSATNESYGGTGLAPAHPVAHVTGHPTDMNVSSIRLTAH